jgi:prolyl-tRNA editing enzyme YbaK/EbsC (Cys-tRNA(Pro) deacylase)
MSLTIKNDDADAIVAEMRVLTSRLIELGCDSVQVISTAIQTGGNETYILHIGKGNAYARLGAVKHWLEKESAEVLAEEVANAMTKYDDGDDDWPVDKGA